VVDQRIVDDVWNGTGNLYVFGGGGPWPTLVGPSPLDDGDHDGIADDWERGRGLDPTNPMDGNGDRNANGYTDLEDYLNELAGDPTCGL
jgi:hypothetical protein